MESCSLDSQRVPRRNWHGKVGRTLYSLYRPSSYTGLYSEFHHMKVWREKFRGNLTTLYSVLIWPAGLQLVLHRYIKFLLRASNLYHNNRIILLRFCFHDQRFDAVLMWEPLIWCRSGRKSRVNGTKATHGSGIANFARILTPNVPE